MDVASRGAESSAESLSSTWSEEREGPRSPSDRLEFQPKCIILGELGHSVKESRESFPRGEGLETMDESQCSHCGISEEERELKKCVMCFRIYCVECEYNRNGRPFCSKQCSELFFFGEED